MPLISRSPCFNWRRVQRQKYFETLKSSVSRSPCFNWRRVQSLQGYDTIRAKESRSPCFNWRRVQRHTFKTIGNEYLLS